jgi:hypothetical protein
MMKFYGILAHTFSTAMVVRNCRMKMETRDSKHRKRQLPTGRTEYRVSSEFRTMNAGYQEGVGSAGIFWNL